MVSAGTNRRQWLALVAATAGSISLAVPEEVSSQTAPAPVQRTVYSTESPAQRLSYEGKSYAWYTATEPCRRRLDKLDVGDPLVTQQLPHIRRYAEMLRRVSGFDWKSVTAAEFLQNILEDLSNLNFRKYQPA